MSRHLTWRKNTIIAHLESQPYLMLHLILGLNSWELSSSVWSGCNSSVSSTELHTGSHSLLGSQISMRIYSLILVKLPKSLKHRASLLRKSSLKQMKIRTTTWPCNRFSQYILQGTSLPAHGSKMWEQWEHVSVDRWNKEAVSCTYTEVHTNTHCRSNQP